MPIRLYLQGSEFDLTMPELLRLKEQIQRIERAQEKEEKDRFMAKNLNLFLTKTS